MINSFRQLMLCFFILLSAPGFCLYLAFLLSANSVLLFLPLALYVEKMQVAAIWRSPLRELIRVTGFYSLQSPSTG